MLSSSRIDPGVLGHLLSQHRELHARLLVLRETFRRPRPPGGAGLEAIRGELRGLRDYLAGHFAQEESGGHLEESIARMPRLSAAARAVLAEHSGLIAELESLLERVSARDIRRVTWSEVAAGFAAFTDHLLDHERNENAVLQQGYNEDFGFPD